MRKFREKRKFIGDVRSESEVDCVTLLFFFRMVKKRVKDKVILILFKLFRKKVEVV